jgi:type II secretory ATPase GspE/PulE/Tfp pilus assembly ATPase PilB-like protein
VFEPGQCDACNERGFRGRVGIFELLPVDEQVASQIVAGCDEVSLLQFMRDKRIPRLRDDAVDKLLAGLACYADIVPLAN